MTVPAVICTAADTRGTVLSCRGDLAAADRDAAARLAEAAAADACSVLAACGDDLAALNGDRAVFLAVVAADRRVVFLCVRDQLAVAANGQAVVFSDMNAFLQRERGVLTEKQRCVALYLQTVAVCQRFAYRLDHAVLQGFGIGGHAGDRVRRNQRLTVKLVGIRVGSGIILRKPVGKCIRKSDVIRVGACRNSGFSVSVIERDVVADRGSQAGSAGSDIRVDDTAVDFNCTASEHSAADRIAVNGTSRCDTGVDDAVVDGDAGPSIRQ